MADSNIDGEEVSSSSAQTNLIERINRIENEINNMKKQQVDITERITKLSEKIDDIEPQISKFEEKIKKQEENAEITESKINNINRSLDNIEKDMSETKSDITDRHNKVKKRLRVIEDMVDIDEIDIAKSMKPDACELEQLAALPNISREEEYPVRVQRAVALYENFHKISTPIRNGGERVLSKDVKTFLNGYSKNTIQYTQVQRVMDSFIEKTGDNYFNQSTSDGRAIIWEDK